jgi:hypothetical protein
MAVNRKMAAQFFKRVEWILEQEGVTYDKQVVPTVITKHFLIIAVFLTSFSDIALAAQLIKVSLHQFPICK